MHRYSGQKLAEDRPFDQHTRSKYGAPFVDFHRCDLQQALYSRSVELGVTFSFGQRVESIDFSGPSALTDTGATFSGDLIIAADGLWSRCRESFLGGKDEPLSTGDLAYRIVLTTDQIKDPKLRAWVENPEVHFWIGPGAHVVGYSLRAGKMYNIVLLVPDDLPAGVARQAGSVDQMRKLFDGWDPM